MAVGRAKTQERGRQARRQVLEAAMEVIAERPVAEIQVQQIAERAGMSPARVLYYFQSRDQILAETFRWSERQLAEQREDDLERGGEPQERLERFVTLYLPKDRHDVSWKLWLEAWLRATSANDLSRMADEFDRGWMADLEAIVGDGVEQGVFTRCDGFVPAFNALLDGLAVHVLIGRLEPEGAVQVALNEAGAKLV
ncbi:TetR/AcrR family transcriptional regulator [Nonomuraea endophytica]|uniref:TetR/AcrR family transcriptional regulator n=1 Tax=Nonomuraea endophytica TaxID=714136 RepID=UPI0037C845DC